MLHCIHRCRPALWLAIVLAFLLAGCAGAGGNTTPTPAASPPAVVDPAASPTAGEVEPAASPTVAEAEPAASPTTAETEPVETVEPTAAVVPGETFQNPVLRVDFPDPHVIEVDGTYYVYATNSGGRNVQVSTSQDLVTWSRPVDAMPALPRWVRLSVPDVWAPEVM